MALSASDLGFRFSTRHVLEGIGLTVEPGSTLAIIGPNGSGKSTLLRLLAGVLQPTVGTAELGGTPVSRIPERRRARHIAYVPQVLSLAFAFDTASYVGFGGHALGGRIESDAVQAALERVGLLSRADDPIGELSVGQRHRAALARAICQLDRMPEGDRFLLADEPTASLDPAHAIAVFDLIDELAARGIGVVAAVHDLAAAARCDRVLLLGDHGSMLASGNPQDIITTETLSRAFGVGFAIHTDEHGMIAAVSARAGD